MKQEENSTVKISKFLSYVLRHNPQEIDLSLDAEGWATISELLAKAPRRLGLNRKILEDVVANNDKKRFRISEDGSMIRASQGHSVTVDLHLDARTPPAVLYHGTATRFVSSIRNQGLLPRSRQHVHLSADTATARSVGSRYGVPSILTIDAGRMHRGGYTFFRSDNGVWLTDRVPTLYISFPSA